MRKFLSATSLIVLLLSLSVQAQQSSIWEGKLMGIRLVLHISEDPATKEMKAVFDSPDQNAKGLPVNELSITSDSLKAYSQLIGGGFNGKFNAAKTEVTGTWAQGGQQVPMVMYKVEAPSELKRPQTPKAPFPYREEKVIYHNADKSIQYGATLTLPASSKPLPVVILISGSGQQDRDANLFGHKIFWVLADHLSRNGIAVLRVDDRAVGQSTGNPGTSADNAQDVLNSIAFLKNHQGINVKKIGLVGHSEGGVIAPLVAVQSKDVAYIVSMAGVGVKGKHLYHQQLEAAYSAAGLAAAEVKQLGLLYEELFKLGQQHQDTDELKAAFQKTYLSWSAKQTAALLSKAGFNGPNGNQIVNQIGASYFSPWMQYFVNYDPATTLPKIKIPLLALNGGKDVQVLAEENLAGFKTLLTQAGNKDFKTLLLPNLNHLFQTAKTGAVSEYPQIEETLAPEALNIITTWINEKAAQ